MLKITYCHNIYFRDQIVTQVLDELGLQLTDQLSGLPSASGSISVATTGKVPIVAQDGGGSSAAGGAAAPQPNDADADLQARLDNLRRK